LFNRNQKLLANGVEDAGQPNMIGKTITNKKKKCIVVFFVAPGHGKFKWIVPYSKPIVLFSSPFRIDQPCHPHGASRGSNWKKGCYTTPVFPFTWPVPAQLLIKEQFPNQEYVTIGVKKGFPLL
jgi:hypothetical protein